MGGLSKSEATQRLRVLVIGIDKYRSLESGQVLYAPLLGAVRDADDVATLFEQEWGVDPAHICKLTNDTATYTAIVGAFRKLIRKARPGDPVWIHFSGHGGRARTFWPEVKGKQGKDEALVPADYSAPGGQYLRDLELAYLLDELVEAGLVVTLVLDCCHAGGAVRDSDGTEKDTRQRRGSGQPDPTARPFASQVATREVLAGGWRRRRGGVLRVEGAESGWLPEPRGYLLLAACRANEAAYEGLFGDQRIGGALTKCLLRELERFPAWEKTGRELYRKLRSRCLDAVPEQTPQLEGAGDRILLGTGENSVWPSPTVLSIDAEKGVLVDAGRAHGLLQGSSLAIHAPTASIRTLEDPLQGQVPDLSSAVATVEITKVEEVAAFGRVVEGEIAAVRPGAPATVLGWGSRRPGRKVALPEELRLSAAWRKELDNLEAYLAREEVIEVVAAGEAGHDVDYRLGVEGDHLVLSLRGEYPALKSTPLSAARRPRSIAPAKSLARQIIHLARFQDVLELTPDPTGCLSGLSLREDPRGASDALRLLLENRSDMVLNVTVLRLDLEDFSIGQVYPDARGAPFRPLDSGCQERLVINTQSSSRATPGRVVFKALGTLEATSFRWLEMSPIDQPFRDISLIKLPGWGWAVAQCVMGR